MSEMQAARIAALTIALVDACNRAGLGTRTLRSMGAAPVASTHKPIPTRELNCPGHLWLLNRPQEHIGPRPPRSTFGRPAALSTLVKDIPDTFTIGDADAELADFDRIESRPEPTDDGPSPAQRRARRLYNAGQLPANFLRMADKSTGHWVPMFPTKTVIVTEEHTKRDTLGRRYKTAKARMLQVIDWPRVDDFDIETLNELTKLWRAGEIDQGTNRWNTTTGDANDRAEIDGDSIDFGPIPEPQDEEGFGVASKGDAHLTELAQRGARERINNANLLDRLHNKYRDLCALSPRHNIAALVGWYQVGWGAVVTTHYNGLTERSRQARREVMFTIADMEHEARAARLAACGPSYILTRKDWFRCAARADQSLSLARNHKKHPVRLAFEVAAQWSRRFACWALESGLLDGEGCTVANILRRQAKLPAAAKPQRGRETMYGLFSGTHNQPATYPKTAGLDGEAFFGPTTDPRPLVVNWNTRAGWASIGSDSYPAQCRGEKYRAEFSAIEWCETRQA